MNVPSTPPVNFGNARDVAPARFVLAGAWQFPDLNREGREDAVFFEISGTERLYAHLGTGDPAKPLSDSIDTRLPRVAAIELAEVNGDGLPTVAFAEAGTTSITFWPGDGADHFTPSDISIADTQQLRVRTSLDANRDGRPDS